MKTRSDWLRLIPALQSENEAFSLHFMTERLLGERGRAGRRVRVYDRKP